MIPIHWLYPELLSLLWGVGVMIVILVGVSLQKGRLLRRLGEPELVKRLMESRNGWKRFLKNLLLVLVMGLGVLALAQPQTLARTLGIERRGVDLVFVVDVSLSMLTEDVKPSRLEQAKEVMRQVVESAPVDRFGVVGFSGKTILFSPLTEDRALLRRQIQEIRTDLVPSTGTSLGAGLKAGLSTLIEHHRKAKILILLTDGEDTFTDSTFISEDVKAAGASLLVVGVGTVEGGPIPLGEKAGEKVLKLDSAGKIVYSKMNAMFLKRVAASARGKCFSKGLVQEVMPDLLHELGLVIEGGSVRDSLVQYENLYQWPLALATILLLIEMTLSERRKVKTP